MKIGIIGAGISGLAVARMLAPKHEVTLWESATRPGGLVKCETVDGVLYHTTGGHVFNSRRQDVLDWFWGIFNKEEGFHKAVRHAVVSLGDGTLVDYPIENHLYQMPQAMRQAVVRDLLGIHAGGYGEPDNFDDFLRRRFGETLYRELGGGYDSQTLRCAADTDLMYRAYQKEGQPLLLQACIVDFQAGGFSANCYDTYRDEFIELLWRNWDEVKRRCLEDRQYLRLIMATLCNHCINLPGWQKRYKREIPLQLDALLTMCAETAGITLNLRGKWALRWLSKHLVPYLTSEQDLPCGMKLRLRLCQCFCHLPKGNKYAQKCPIPGGTLTVCLLGAMNKALHAPEQK